MPKRQGRNDFGFNLQTRKDNSVKIHTNFYVVVLIEMTLNRTLFGEFAVRCDEKLFRYSRLELQSCLCELGLRHNPVAILVEFDKLCRVSDRKRQCRLQAVHALADREAA